MKYKLLSIRGEEETNIGDYVQALASSQFFPSLDGFINREELKDYDGEECKVIMNGWYMHHPEQWPPSEKILPLYVAVHFNSTAKEKLLSDESVQYLKRYEPIGCRDNYTADLLQNGGVKAYFSGCMTLTLGLNFHSDKKDGKCYFVDPYFVTRWNLWNILRNAVYLLLHWRPINIIASKYPESKTGLRKKMILTTFYREYRKMFSKKALLEAEYINQQSAYYKNHFPTDESRLEEAKRLVKKYAQAKLVVTSRIHCALPCLGLETPVIYVEDSAQSEASACRFGGLRELFNIISWEKDHLSAEFCDKLPLDNLQNWQNKDNWRSLADALIAKCKSFVASCQRDA